MSGSELLKTFATLVPEFYYDLIARIIPGVVTLLAAVLMYTVAFDSAVWALLYNDASLMDSILFLVVAYFTGVVLGPFGALTRYPFWWWAKLRTIQTDKDIAREFAEKRNMQEAPFSQLGAFKRFEKKVEAELSEHFPHDRAVLVKMWAESDMCLNVLAGILLANVVIFLTSYAQGSVESWSSLQPAVLPIAALILLGANYRHRGVIRRDLAYVDRLGAATATR